jgi:hypothetical protein
MTEREMYDAIHAYATAGRPTEEYDDHTYLIIGLHANKMKPEEDGIALEGTFTIIQVAPLVKDDGQMGSLKRMNEGHVTEGAASSLINNADNGLRPLLSDAMKGAGRVAAAMMSGDINLDDLLEED